MTEAAEASNPELSYKDKGDQVACQCSNQETAGNEEQKMDMPEKAGTWLSGTWRQPRRTDRI